VQIVLLIGGSIGVLLIWGLDGFVQSMGVASGHARHVETNIESAVSLRHYYNNYISPFSLGSKGVPPQQSLKEDKLLSTH